MRLKLLPTAVVVTTAAVGLATLTVPATAGAAARHPHHRAGMTKFDWAAYHGNRSRTGRSTSMPRFRGGLHVARRLGLDAEVYASPLVVDGKTVVATENNTVYVFGPHYRLIWKRHLAAPSPAQQRPCGDIDPLGITSTPIYLRSTNTVYVAAEYGNPRIQHYLVGFNFANGHIRFRRHLDLPGADPTVMQLRGALTDAGGRVWASFGALAGDCGNYKGRAVGVRLDGKGRLLKFQPSPRRQGGIWNPSGPTVDGSGDMYLVSANGSAFPGDAYDHTNSVNKINPRTGKRIDSFAPTHWAENNQADVGLGSQGVALVGGKWAVLGGKSGQVYVLRRHHLGGIGGQVSTQNICPSYGGAAVRGVVTYLPCTDGVRAVKVGSRGRMQVLWHASSSVTGAPVVGGGVVWSLDTGAGRLYALGLAHGSTRASVDVGGVTRFATPALSGRRILVPTTSGLTVVTY